MTTTDTTQPPAPGSRVPATDRPSTLRIWLALVAMGTMSFALVSAEFLPSGLLTAMATDLGVSDGVAGQAVTVTAGAGFFAALFVGNLTPGLDRRTLLVAMALAAAVSNVAVAFAPSLWLLLVARVLLGVALSGFWSMSLTVAAQIIGAERMGRGMMMVNAGTTLASVLGVPLGVLVSGWWDWRTVFILMAVLTVAVALALRVLLPSVPAEPGLGLASLRRTLLVRGMPQGLVGHVLVVFGQIAAYTFIRVALERVPGVDVDLVATLLLVFGIGGFIGNFALGAIADRRLAVLRFAVPAGIGVSTLLLALWPSLPVVVVAVALWGASFGGWLVVLNTWLARQVPDQLEAGGGLAVAGFQLAIAAGAAIGGLILEAHSITATLLVASAAALLGGALFGTAPSRRHTGREG